MSEQDTSQDFSDHDPPPRDPGSGDGTQAPPQGPPRRLTRRTDDRVLGGVASGLGDYFNVDPAIFRLVFIVLTFFGGSGVMLYGLGWLFLPDRTTGKAVGEDLFRRGLGGRSVVRWLVIGLVAAVIIHAVMHEGGMLWAIVLVALGVFAFRHNESSAATDTAGEPPAAVIPPPPPSSAPTQPLMQRPLSTPPPASVESSTIFDDWRPTPITAPPEPPPPPSVLGRITVAAALMLIGLVALIQNLSPLDVSVDHYAALALAVVGAGLLVGARLGRAHGLIVLGVILAVVMALSAALPDVPIAGAPGQQTWTPATVADLRDHYELGAGELVLDLTDLELEPGQHVAVAASVGLGQLVVDVPPETTIDVDATSNLGEVVAFDLDSEGSNATIDHIKRGPEGSPTIALDLTVGAGQIEVTEASVSADPSERPTVPRRPE